MGRTISTAGFPSAAIASSCFTARCDSIWYGFFIATLLFLRKRNCSQPIKGFERGVATFYDLPGILSSTEPPQILNGVALTSSAKSPEAPCWAGFQKVLDPK